MALEEEGLSARDMANEGLSELARRVRELEDEREIVRLISAYGPAVDSGQSERAAAIWTESGVYDTDSAVWRGRAEIAGMVEGSFHQQLIAGGAAHVVGVPHVRLSGDAAVATCYSRVFRHVDGAFEVWRVAVNRWELVRTPEGWRTAYRTNRLINGSDAARELLGRAGED
jgi:uncharacterized protein (TIGR02246 family)